MPANMGYGAYQPQLGIGLSVRDVAAVQYVDATALRPQRGAGRRQEGDVLVEIADLGIVDPRIDPPLIGADRDLVWGERHRLAICRCHAELAHVTGLGHVRDVDHMETTFGN